MKKPVFDILYELDAIKHSVSNLVNGIKCRTLTLIQTNLNANDLDAIYGKASLLEKKIKALPEFNDLHKYIQECICVRINKERD